MTSTEISNHKTVTVKHLRRRLLTSALGILFFLSVIVMTVVTIKNGDTEDGAPYLLRKGLNANSRVGSAILSATHLSVSQPRPPQSKEPRVNGDVGLSELIDLATYTVVVESGDKTLNFRPEQFKSMPKTEVSTEFKCVEGWSEIVQYGGVKFSDFLEINKLGRKADGSLYRYVGMETPDGEYYVSLDMKSMLHPQTVLAYEMNQHPLSEENGFPIRLIIPIKYGIKSLKRIGRIFFSDNRPADYWAEEGYDWFAGL
jgi:hypothetical protein